MKREVEEAHQRGENSWLVACCVLSSSQGDSLYRRVEGAGLPLPQGKGAVTKGGKT
jgi:hypothetical protein